MNITITPGEGQDRRRVERAMCDGHRHDKWTFTVVAHDTDEEMAVVIMSGNFSNLKTDICAMIRAGLHRDHDEIDVLVEFTPLLQPGEQRTVEIALDHACRRFGRDMKLGVVAQVLVSHHEPPYPPGDTEIIVLIHELVIVEHEPELPKGSLCQLAGDLYDDEELVDRIQRAALAEVQPA